jgi:hypothetical protein
LPIARTVDRELTRQYHSSLTPRSEARSFRTGFARRLRWNAPFPGTSALPGLKQRAMFAEKCASIEMRHSVQISFTGFFAALFDLRPINLQESKSARNAGGRDSCATMWD